MSCAISLTVHMLIGLSLLPQGIKLELFIFDTFPLAKAVSLMEVPRAQQFSPLKNGPSEAEDSPVSARRDVMQLHAGWVSIMTCRRVLCQR